tara:strand:+ start:546 stop:650 length:105 start_codon:yes stop_codon:yes gene_type:complete
MLFATEFELSGEISEYAEAVNQNSHILYIAKQQQ